MKYTPLDMLGQIREAKLEEPIEGLIRAGYGSYQFLELHGPVTQIGENTFFFQSEERQNGQQILACEFGNFPLEAYEHTDRMTVGTVFWTNQVYFIGFWQGEEMPAHLRERLLLDFLVREEIDTRGRLKKLLRDHFEIIQT